MSVTPSARLGFGTLIVETLGSSAFKKATPPPVKSTRKLKAEGVKQPTGESYLEGTLDTGMSLKLKTLYLEEHEGEDNKLENTFELNSKQSKEYISRSSEETDPEVLHTNLTSELSQQSISSTSAGEELEGKSLIKRGRDDAFDLTENQKEQKLAQEAADRAAKTLAKSIAVEAEKRVKPIEEGQDQSLTKEQTKAAREAIAEQA